MFDVSFSELLLIGVIALIVIGPERLPKVARTIGHLVGRAQRYVSDVKTDIQREMDVDEITNLKGQMEEAANTVKASIADAGNSLRNPIDEAKEALKDAQASLKDATDSVNAAVKPALEDKGDAEKAGAALASSAAAGLAIGSSNEAIAAATPQEERPEPDPSEATLPLPGFDDEHTLPNAATKPSTGTTPT
ncbi:MAG TPA: Sec-independent protein translocase protein TatB [Eoetvoesiella sp.]